MAIQFCALLLWAKKWTALAAALFVPSKHNFYAAAQTLKRVLRRAPHVLHLMGSRWCHFKAAVGMEEGTPPPFSFMLNAESRRTPRLRSVLNHETNTRKENTYEADAPQSSFNLNFCHQILPRRSPNHRNHLRWHHPVSFCVQTPASVSSRTPYSSPKLASEPAATSNLYTNMAYRFPQMQNFNKSFCGEKLLI